MSYSMIDATKARYSMNDAERAERSRVKALHAKLRAPLKDWKNGCRRYDLLAWAYARGLPFRRCERSHHTQKLEDGRLFEHNMPHAMLLWQKLALAGAIPCDVDPSKPWLVWRDVDKTPVGQAIQAWIDDPRGAIAAPPPRVKKVYSQAAE
jgi:hypothetical protein